MTTASLKLQCPPSKRVGMYLAILGVWIISSLFLWADFANSLHVLDSSFDQVVTGIVVFFINLGWLFGFYHLGLVSFTLLQSNSFSNQCDLRGYNLCTSPIAILHTVCDDFQEQAALSCITQDYPRFHVYVLDDSTSSDCKKRVDEFCLPKKDFVTVIRRKSRDGFKAGNLNHALSLIQRDYKYYALADSDTYLPPEFLRKTAQILEECPDVTFVQAVHVANDSRNQKMGRDLGKIVRIGWNFYQPIRNIYGLPMCYGHGALLRYTAIKAVGGFPEIVSEDIALTLKLRELGYKGCFTSDVICGEDYPDQFHSFRKRLSRWVSADLECSREILIPFLLVKQVSVTEKLDATFRGLKVPLASMFFPMTVMMSLMPYLFSGWKDILGSYVIFVTLLTGLAAYMCFIVDMAHQPRRLFMTLSHLTTVYTSNALLITIRMIEALLLKRSRFYVTGTNYEKLTIKKLHGRMLTIDEAGYPLIGVLEIVLGVVLLVIGIHSINFIVIGLSLALLLAPAIYIWGWDHRFVSKFVHFPFVFILAGIIFSFFLGDGTGTQCLVLATLSILLF